MIDNSHTFYPTTLVILMEMQIHVNLIIMYMYSKTTKGIKEEEAES